MPDKARLCVSMVRQSPSRSLLNNGRTSAEHVKAKHTGITTQVRHSSTLSKDNPTPPASPFVLSRSADFKKINASRPPFEQKTPITTSQSPTPTWKYGDAPTNTSSNHIEIDPSTRPFIHNYKLLISAIPRPISLVSTINKSGHKNLAPFSYFQVVDHDPPIFVIGFSARPGRLKDTRRNLVETGECVISVVSEDMVQGVNAASLDVPFGVSEWELSGFRGAAASTVRPKRVLDAVFSVEGKLLEMKELNYHGGGGGGSESGALAIIEGTRFWVRRDAVSESGDEVKLDVMRPVVGLGGISYGRVRETFELARGYLPEELKDTENGLARILDSEQQKVKS